MIRRATANATCRSAKSLNKNTLEDGHDKEIILDDLLQV